MEAIEQNIVNFMVCRDEANSLLSSFHKDQMYHVCFYPLFWFFDIESSSRCSILSNTDVYLHVYDVWSFFIDWNGSYDYVFTYTGWKKILINTL